MNSDLCAKHDMEGSVGCSVCLKLKYMKLLDKIITIKKGKVKMSKFNPQAYTSIDAAYKFGFETALVQCGELFSKP